jgi:hypothetical protein
MFMTVSSWFSVGSSPKRGGDVYIFPEVVLFNAYFIGAVHAILKHTV